MQLHITNLPFITDFVHVSMIMVTYTWLADLYNGNQYLAHPYKCGKKYVKVLIETWYLSFLIFTCNERNTFNKLVREK